MGSSSSAALRIPSASTSIGTAAKPPGRRSSWRHKDSSEKTPSTAESDAAYIVPGVPLPLASTPPTVVSSGSPVCRRSGARLSDNIQRPASRHSIEPDFAATPAFRELPWLQVDETQREQVEAAHPPNPASRVTNSSASIISPPLSNIVYRRRQKKKEEQKNAAPPNRLAPEPVLAPLAPRYYPPKRRPTPPGLPSFDTPQRPLASRLALRHPGLGPSGGSLGNVRTFSSGVSNGPFSGLSLWRRRGHPIQVLSSRSSLGTGRYRPRNSSSSQQGTSSGTGTHGLFGMPHSHSATFQSTQPRPLPSVWRPPVSQHTLGNHPLSRDIFPPPGPPPPAPVAASIRQEVPQTAPSRPNEINGSANGGLQGVNSTTATTATATAEATAEMEARYGRSARPVTLDDYTFLQEERDIEATNVLSDDTADASATTTSPATPAAHAATGGPVALVGAATHAATDIRQGRNSAERSPLASMSCPCQNWRMPH